MLKVGYQGGRDIKQQSIYDKPTKCMKGDCRLGPKT